MSSQKKPDKDSMSDKETENDREMSQTDLRTLKGIVRGPGTYATPSKERLARLQARGLISVSRGTIRPTWLGRWVAFWS